MYADPQGTGSSRFALPIAVDSLCDGVTRAEAAIGGNGLWVEAALDATADERIAERT